MALEARQPQYGHAEGRWEAERERDPEGGEEDERDHQARYGEEYEEESGDASSQSGGKGSSFVATTSTTTSEGSSMSEAEFAAMLQVLEDDLQYVETTVQTLSSEK